MSAIHAQRPSFHILLMSLCEFSRLTDWNENPFIPIQVSVPAFNWILFGPTWWEQCVFWMQVMGRLSDIFPSQGPSLSIFYFYFFLFEQMFDQTELKFHKTISITAWQNNNVTLCLLPNTPSPCENSSHRRILMHLFVPSSDEKSKDPHLDKTMSDRYCLILSLTFESPSKSFFSRPNYNSQIISCSRKK